MKGVRTSIVAAALLCAAASAGAVAGEKESRCLLNVGQSRGKVLIEETSSSASSDSGSLGDDARSENTTDFQLRMRPGGAHDFLCAVKSKAHGMQFPVLKVLSEGFGEKGMHKGVCALVSSSGVLLNHRHGAEIDSADWVIRFNDAEVGGALREYVGERDDMRILNGNMDRQIFLENPPLQLNNRTLYVLQRVYPFSDKEHWQYLQQHIASRPDLHFVVGNNQVEEVAKSVLGEAFSGNVGASKLTTGWIGGMLALSLCEEVRAYGFPETSDSAAAPHHYYGSMVNGSASENFIHYSAAGEKLLWRALATNDDVDSTAVAVVPGFHNLACEDTV
mmetsp:Transcript_39532/g.93012  ORF Transcript_39532/g.93012 Transcript_39532/m.93012 type:complete len:334 (+) Transcript_39532:70-1071(+)